MDSKRARGQGGFTLIELLVVIAIIGILTSIVLVAIGSARSGAADSNVKANLSTIRTQAELYAINNGNTYGVFIDSALPPIAGSASQCLDSTYTAGTLFNDPTIKAALTSAQKASGGVMRCFSDGNTWVAAVQLKTTINVAWCVASNAKAVQINTSNMLGVAIPSSNCLY